ncbi:MAG: heavy-metal-associated domain-containing protein [Saprospiraceae bacterium]|nr:heavy-metal-associated domain-containing protein [Saprospiraceae bacterium]
MNDLTLSIDKMKCQGCVEAIRTSLAAIDPQCVVRVDLPAKLLNVRLSTLVQEAIILNALESIGFAARVVKH